MMDTSSQTSTSSNPSVDSAERGWIRGLVLTITLIGALWLGSTMSNRMMDVCGEPAGCVTMATSKIDAILTFAAVMTLLSILAMVAGRLVNAVVGVFVLGAGLAALTLQSASISGAIFSDASLTSLAIETIIWTVPCAISVVLVFRFSGAPPDIAPRFPGESMWKEYFDSDALRGAIVGVLLPLVAWLVIRSMSKGQAFGGACLGGVAVGIAFRLVSPRVLPVLAFIAPILVAGVYQFFVASRLPSDLGTLFATNALAPELRMMPLDVVAGTLTGVAIGIGWARSFRRSDTITS
ncbi:MAG: hypothetical protein O2875_08165 [Planctomycetota bacterium]|nr:hypothetical protein [Planctomycetota bacterium]MDA1262777.1 hypothetical protein [Planctomycetota bacterium]